MLQGDDEGPQEKLLFGLLAMLSTSTRLRSFNLLDFYMSLDTVSTLTLLPLSLRGQGPNSEQIRTS